MNLQGSPQANAAFNLLMNNLPMVTNPPNNGNRLVLANSGAFAAPACPSSGTACAAPLNGATASRCRATITTSCTGEPRPGAGRWFQQQRRENTRGRVPGARGVSCWRKRWRHQHPCAAARTTADAGAVEPGRAALPADLCPVLDDRAAGRHRRLDGYLDGLPKDAAVAATDAEGRPQIYRLLGGQLFRWRRPAVAV